MDANGTHHVKLHKLDSESFISSIDIHRYIHTKLCHMYDMKVEKEFYLGRKETIMKGERRQKRMMGWAKAKHMIYMHQDVLQKLNKNMDNNNLGENLKPYKINT